MSTHCFVGRLSYECKFDGFNVKSMALFCFYKVIPFEILTFLVYFREQMLIEKLLPCHHNRLENEVIILARILENYMYFVAPSLEHYNNLSTLSFVTKLFVVYIATRYCQQEDVDVRTLHRLYCSVI